MEIIIQQLFCGENTQKAWGLLKSTMSDISEAQSIAFKADLQDRPPTGLTWQPFLRGFLDNKYFIIMKTYSDNSQNVRSGRAFSHVLAIPREQIVGVKNLGPILELFGDEMDKTREIEPIILEDVFLNQANYLSSNNRFNKVLNGYLNAEESNNTIVWVGQENFADALINLWNLLLPEEILNLNFGICFNPNGIDHTKINFLATLDSLENKFAHSGYCVVKKNDEHQISSFSELYFSGDPVTVERVKYFQESLEVASLSKSDMKLLAKLVDNFEKMASLNDLRKLTTLSNLFAKFAPSANKGKEIKNKLLHAILVRLSSADLNEYCVLKQVNISSIAEAELELVQASQEWIRLNFLSGKVYSPDDIRTLFEKSFSSEIQNWWSQLNRREILNFASKIDNKKADVIIGWLKTDFCIFRYISDDIDKNLESEEHFLNKLSQSILKKNSEELLDFAISNSWFRLCAMILMSTKSMSSALEEQVNVDTDERHLEGIKIIVQKMTADTLVDSALKIGDPRLIGLAGSVCFSNPVLVNKLIADQESGFKIWEVALKEGLGIEDGLIDPRSVIYQILDSVAVGQGIPELILEKISISVYGDLSNYVKRRELWTLLPNNVRKNFLSRTATSVLEVLSKNPSGELPIDDPEIKNYIMSGDVLRDFLYYNRNNLSGVLPIFEAFPQLPERVIEDYIRNLRSNLEIVDSVRLGKLISNRGLRSAANEIASKVLYNYSFGPAIGECSHLLGFFAKFKLMALPSHVFQSELSADEWWKEFTEIAYTLYSAGPTHNKIWVQAGGQEYDLLTRATGKEIWISALKKLRQGNCNGITLEILINKMIEEHSKNEQLITLKELLEKL